MKRNNCFRLVLVSALLIIHTPKVRAEIVPLPKTICIVSTSGARASSRATNPSGQSTTTTAEATDTLRSSSQLLAMTETEREAPSEEEAQSTAAPTDQALKSGSSLTKDAEIQLSFSYEDLTNGYAPWRSVALDFSKKLAERKVVYGTFRETSRFSLGDQEVLAGLYYPLGRHWTALFEATASPSHQVLPKFSVLGQLEHSFGKGWNAQAGIRHTVYDAARTNLGIFTLERYFENYRAGYTLYISQLEGAGLSAGHRVQGDRYYGQGSRVGLGFAFGRELENVGPPRGILRTETKNVFLVGEHWFAAHWAIAYEVGWHKQGDLYTKRGASVGLRYRF